MDGGGAKGQPGAPPAPHCPMLLCAAPSAPSADGARRTRPDEAATSCPRVGCRHCGVFATGPGVHDQAGTLHGRGKSRGLARGAWTRAQPQGARLRRGCGALRGGRACCRSSGCCPAPPSQRRCRRRCRSTTTNRGGAPCRTHWPATSTHWHNSPAFVAAFATAADAAATTAAAAAADAVAAVTAGADSAASVQAPDTIPHSFYGAVGIFPGGDRLCARDERAFLRGHPDGRF
eukprot:COSAG01_NODE_19882_length_983_cov_26.995475_1_plen_233_part_00